MLNKRPAHLVQTGDMALIRHEMNQCGRKAVPFLFAVNFEMSEGLFLKTGLETSEVFYQVGNIGHKPPGLSPARPGPLIARPPDPEEYLGKFRIVQRGLRRGDSYLTNLTLKTPVDCPLTLKDIFLLSDSPYRLHLPGRFVCFSPERFVQIKEGRISTNPMKGTIDASLPEAEAGILADFKETAEHNTIVDLLRNDLSRWADGVQVARFRYIDRIVARERTILQVSSEIVGTLPPDYLSSLGDIIFSLLPAGSCTGAPKGATVRLIKQAEGEERGYYTGVFGLFDGRALDSAVLIRFIEEDAAGRKFFRSGGGITAYSRWEDEYREVLEKIYLPFGNHD
jgi:para-aminobenzoate synthetase component 1